MCGKRHLAVFCAIALQLQVVTSLPDVIHICPPHTFISDMTGIFDMNVADRAWDFACRGGLMLEPPNTFGPVNQYGGMLAFHCPGNSVISGVHSLDFDDLENDRLWKFDCSEIKDIPCRLDDCILTDFLNNFQDLVVSFVVPQGRVIVGVYSCFDCDKGDRRWKVEHCGLRVCPVQVTTTGTTTTEPTTTGSTTTEPTTPGSTTTEPITCPSCPPTTCPTCPPTTCPSTTALSNNTQP